MSKYPSYIVDYINDSFLEKELFGTKTARLKTDYFIENDEVVLNIDVAGSSSEDVKVSYNSENNSLTVRIAKQYEKKDIKPNFYIRERMISDQSRSFYLPPEIDSSSIAADVKNGLLTIKAKLKTKSYESSTITIKVNS
jgi:HSP20 family molecular chaperone IbpA